MSKFNKDCEKILEALKSVDVEFSDIPVCLSSIVGTLSVLNGFEKDFTLVMASRTIAEAFDFTKNSLSK